MASSELADLDAVRAAIDALDSQLIELLVRRQHLVSRAGAFKRNDEEVRAPERATAVIARARRLAEEAGGSADVIGDIFEAMVAAYIEHERAGR